MTAIKIEGSQIHKNSHFITIRPQLLNRPLIPKGETVIGVQGKKYLVSSKGDNKAIPNPPFVKASRIPWLADKRKKKIKKKNHCFENNGTSLKKAPTMKILNSSPKNGE